MEKEIRQCNKCKENFDLDQDDFSFYKKMKVPAPNVCPDCRFKMKAIWRNEMSLYSGRKCFLCKKNILSMYNPKSKYVNYCYDCWHSDKWNAKDYSKNYDFNKSFFEQLGELISVVPKINLYSSPSEGGNVNSEYINFAGGCKNCYLVFNTSTGEEVLYSRGCRRKTSNSSDLYFVVSSELCYESINTTKSSSIIWGQNVSGCVDCYFISNCSGLTNCFGCVNLRNKSNCWFNEQLNIEEYKERLEEIKGSYKKLKEIKNKFLDFSKNFPKRENNNTKIVNCIGDYLFECKNVYNSFEISNSENCKNIFSSLSIKDSIGTIGFGRESELLLEVVGVGFSSNIIGSLGVENSQDVLYSFFVKNSRDCIGCDGLKNVQYCIFNKQYTKEEYEKIKEHIIKELTELGINGLMMPVEISPFAYNETIAQDNMPLTKEEALAQGFRWEDDIQITHGKETILPENIPDHIKDVNDSITGEILKCIDCERNYKITEQELLFYRKMILPIPRKCFFCRHKDRVRRRGPFKFFVRKCDNCGKETYTNLTKEVAPIMYCEKCYQQEVI